MRAGLYCGALTLPHSLSAISDCGMSSAICWRQCSMRANSTITTIRELCCSSIHCLVGPRSALTLPNKVSKNGDKYVSATRQLFLIDVGSYRVPFSLRLSSRTCVPHRGYDVQMEKAFTRQASTSCRSHRNAYVLLPLFTFVTNMTYMMHPASLRGGVAPRL
ncbi:hypothetical protein NEOLEDRAFT_395098 [Neolentinus lepideus HHB14362 ss-1]|uniref:Uncharacterized protein n=1 Tax=Neolentinus lepideus HHB14362 ss-1 TaxID=1314782 RepID=A0A165S8E9_9AGAM|nr:hypothetical protein NEOLEDRAFT_395098 [Neolentinus lepideus HHB14362 ss-1]